MPNWTKQQLEAIETEGSNIIVSAGAGSGKTAVLTNRVLNKLHNNIHINELLILTFTNAAALGMKERIRKVIKKDESLKEELELIDSSYITTFDSYALSVVRKYHYYLNIPKDVGITDNTIILIKQKEILDKIFDEYYAKNDEKFNKLINDFCIKDDKDIKKSILDIASKISLIINKDEYLNTYIDKYFSDNYIDSLIEEYNNLILQKKDGVLEALEDLKYYSDSDYYIKVSNSLENLLNTLTIDDILSLEIKIPYSPSGSDGNIKNARGVLKSRVDEILSFRKYGLSYELKDNILNTKDVVEAIINILKKYFKELDEFKEKNNIYDFMDIALLSIKLVKENENVRNEIKNSFKEIMIDEYQDTSDIQEEFIKLISDNNVYMVGDIKQSIYRFRNANPYIFKEKYDNYSKLNGGIKIDLLDNFRSRSEVLDNINTIFRLVMDNEYGGADYAISHEMIPGNKAYVLDGKTNQNYNMELLEYDINDEFSKDEIEIFTIGNDIKNKIKNKYKIFDKDTKEFHSATYSDFVILLDRSTQFDIYRKIFDYLGIPISINKDEKINEGYDLDIIKSLIDIVIHIKEDNLDTKFKYDFISIARSYLYSLDDDVIFSYFLNDNFKESIVYKNLESISINLNSKTVYELLLMIIDKTNMYEKLSSLNNIDNSLIRIEKLLEVSKNLSDIGYDIYKFNLYLENLIEDNYEISYSVNDMNSDSVRIMTIHKSKGLEYNVCYYAGLDKKFTLKEIKDRFTFSNKYGLIVPLFSDGIKETIIKELLKNNYLNEEISEKIRLFYVALTRAKEKMIFVIPSKDSLYMYINENGVIKNTVRSRYRNFLDIILSIKKELNSYIVHYEPKKLSNKYLFNREKNIKLDVDDKLVVNEIKIDNEIIDSSSYSKKLHELVSLEKHSNLELGLKVHEILELLDFNNPNLNLIKDKFISDCILKFLESDLMKNKYKAKIYKEYEFMYQSDLELKHGIIDLMMEYDDYIDIIDYKLNNIMDDNYINQLNGYKEYIEKISNKKVNLYLYSIISKEVKRIS